MHNDTPNFPVKKHRASLLVVFGCEFSSLTRVILLVEGGLVLGAHLGGAEFRELDFSTEDLCTAGLEGMTHRLSHQ
jgi:hypothetical protein